MTCGANRTEEQQPEQQQENNLAVEVKLAEAAAAAVAFGRARIDIIVRVVISKRLMMVTADAAPAAVVILHCQPWLLRFLQRRWRPHCCHCPAWSLRNLNGRKGPDPHH